MKIVIFGLTVSSSWGNGHATLWRGLIGALGARGHAVTFYERDVPYYAHNRDLSDLDGGRLALYRAWPDVAAAAERELAAADVAIVTSYCPDALAATDLALGSPARIRCFYDLDTPVTLAALDAGAPVAYLGRDGLRGFDLALSYTGGPALSALRDRLGARCVAPLYGAVDPRSHRPAAPAAAYAADLSYIGTYAADRQAALQRLFIDAARRAPDRKFLIAGAQYPHEFPWTPNIYFVRHLPPAEHPAFYSSCRLTLNVTRPAMAAMGWCPSGRLFEAAAAGAPVLSDDWPGLDAFFEPGREILIARSTEEALAALDLDDAALRRVAERARTRALDQHTAAHRALDFEAAIDQAVEHAAAAAGRRAPAQRALGAGA